MKLTISTKSFKNALSLASHFISSKQQLPILGNIYLKSTKSNLLIGATNLESSVSINLAAKIEDEGEITLPGKTIVDIISNLNSDTVDIELDKEHLKLHSGSFKSKVLGMNATDFPKIPNSVEKETFVIEMAKIKDSLEKVLFAVSSDETRPVLTGVLLEQDLEKNNIYLVGTDGFRLSKKIIPLKSVEFERIIIPRNILYELLKLENDNQLKVLVNKEDGQVVFSCGEITFSSRIIEGEYPPYQKIIPEGYSLKMFVDKDDLTKAVKLASVFSRDSGNIVKFEVKKEKLKIIAESSSSGNQETEMEIKTETDSGNVSDLIIQFNYKFVEDVLKSITSEEVVVEFNGQDKAGKFLDLNDKNFLHLIMPIKQS